MASHTIRNKRTSGTLLLNVGGQAVKVDAGKTERVPCTAFPGQGGCDCCRLEQWLTAERKAEVVLTLEAR